MAVEKEHPVNDAVVARIDERTKSIQSEIAQFRHDLRNNLVSIDVRIKDTDERLSDQIGEVKESFINVAKKMDTEFVKKTEFALIQKIVYGFVSIIVVSVVTALLASVIIAPKASSFATEKSIVVK